MKKNVKNMKKIVAPPPGSAESGGVWRYSFRKDCYDLWGGNPNVLLDRKTHWPKPPGLSVPLWPYYFIENRRCDRQWYRHVNYPGMAVTLVLSGKIEYTEDRHSMTAGAGEVVIQLPGTSDRMVNADDAPSHKLCLIFAGSTGAAIAAMFGIVRNTKLKCASPAAVEKRMRRLGRLLGRRQPGSEFKVAEEAYALWLELIRQRREPASPESLRPLLAVMEKASAETCSCKELAERSGLSGSTLLRLTRKHFGCTPKAYMLGKRLERGAALLGGGCSVKEAALQCGFADSGHFSRAFKKHFGLSPSVFRTAESAVPGVTGEAVPE